MRLLVALLINFSLLACSPEPAATTAALPTKSATKPIVLAKKFRDLNFDRIRKIVCWHGVGKGRASGTAFVIRENILVTAAHVVDEKCKDSATGLPVRAYYVDWDNDFALVTMDTGPLTDVMEYKCDGFTAGERYSAIGFSGGLRLRETRLVASGLRTGLNGLIRINKTETRPSIHLYELNGNIYRGMSGGPVIDEEGIVVGINSTTDDNGHGGSRELRDTILCGAPRHNPDGLRVIPYANIPGATTE